MKTFLWVEFNAENEKIMCVYVCVASRRFRFLHSNESIGLTKAKRTRFMRFAYIHIQREQRTVGTCLILKDHFQIKKKKNWVCECELEKNLSSETKDREWIFEVFVAATRFESVGHFNQNCLLFRRCCVEILFTITIALFCT